MKYSSTPGLKVENLRSQILRAIAQRKPLVKIGDKWIEIKQKGEK